MKKLVRQDKDRDITYKLLEVGKVELTWGKNN